jgi:hypothetical protein
MSNKDPPIQGKGKKTDSVSRGQLLDVQNQYLDYVEPAVHGMLAAPHAMSR